MGLSEHPLVVDLDGTLIFTDVLQESAISAFKRNPLVILRLPLWLAQGKAYLKQRLAAACVLDATTLPYNQALIDWLRQQKSSGRRIVLCTAADRTFAGQIAEHLNIFDETMASDGHVNLAGESKARALVARFGHAAFDYAGNSFADLSVWRVAHAAILVNASPKTTAKARMICHIDRVFAATPVRFSIWRRLLRMHQWLKNVLLFVPILAAHELLSAKWKALALAFVSFSVCASAVYIANDLLDLDSDRAHPRKRMRPFASGQVSALIGVVLAPLLLLTSVVLAALVGGNFLAWLLVYFALTCAYSLGLKRLMLIDCLTLAILYTLRIIAGGAAAGNGLSFWLLAFSVFLFLSLAFVKRYAELEIQLLSGQQRAHGRGYITSDAPLIQTFGIASGYGSVMVLALYLNSDAVTALYRTPQVMWGVVPVMLFWISWMWLQAHRGNMHDDPLVFAVKDKASWGAGLLFVLVLLAGSLGWPW